VAGDNFHEDGWRALSPSRASRAFAKLGWSEGSTNIALSGHFADTDLNGNGLQEMRLLAADRSSIYTAPDNTRNRMGLLVLKGETGLARNLTCAAMASGARSIPGPTMAMSTTMRSGKVSTSPMRRSARLWRRRAIPASPCRRKPGQHAVPKWRCIANVLLNSEPNEKCDGLINRSQTRQSEWGVTFELEWAGHLADGAPADRGLSYVRSVADFTQSTQFGYPAQSHDCRRDRPGAFADGTQDSKTHSTRGSIFTRSPRPFGLCARSCGSGRAGQPRSGRTL
jgi:hypothetical protein